jgi:hypothetical protein
MNEEISSLIREKIAKLPKSLFSISVLLIGAIISLTLIVVFILPLKGYYEKELNVFPNHSKTDSVFLNLPSFVINNIQDNSIVIDSNGIKVKVIKVDRERKNIGLEISCQQDTNDSILIHIKFPYVTNVYRGLLYKRSQ